MRLPRTIFVEIFPPVLAVILISLIAAIWQTTESMRAFHRDEVSTTLETRARLIEREIDGRLNQPEAGRLDALCKELGQLTGSRITIILPTGQVVGDSEEDPAVMDNHADRPEVMTALAGGVGRATRYSHTLNSDREYVAIPVYGEQDGQIQGIIRVSESLASVDHALNQVHARAALGTAVVAVLAAFITFLVTRRVARPLKQIVSETHLLAQGELSTRIHVPRSVELAELANAMNQMAGQLRERIEVINHQRSELDAVLSSMAEGVIAIGMDERVLKLNRAAAIMLDANSDLVRGRNVQEVVRNPKFLSCIERMLAQLEPFEDEIVLAGPIERFIHLSASGLRDVNGKELGALFVLQDITEQRRLERARSDFIANVSHELRTPVTSIKGYAETLLAEGKNDPETLERFLAIIARQADRLSALVDDTLSLTALERSEAAQDIPFETLGVQGLLGAAAMVCSPAASAKNIHITIDSPEELTVLGNELLLERAVVNLLDNAVKCSAADSEVRLIATQTDDGTSIHVQDFGMGISAEHLPRIFERFYRVDSARSRKLGGTGLGLAIVKHIVTLHGGTVTVKSAPGKGSCFTIHLPKKSSLR